jgi:hypothetical protein
MEYITLDAQGFQGDIYKSDQNFQDSMLRTKSLAGNSQYTGQFGMQSSLGANVVPSCQGRGDAYAQAMTQQYKRQAQSMQNGMEGYMRRQASGF